MVSKSNTFSKRLLTWYDPNARSLPWKFIKDPYKIWISEIILQQTRAEQAIPYYHNFLKLFPTVTKLANADLDQVLKAWEGLGYYSRARNLHKAAIFIKENNKGKIPTTYDELLALSGIGPYTAAAISSFAFGEAKAVLDGNVYRVLARIFGIDDPINVSSSKKVFQNKLQSVFDKKEPALFNQSIMDFGATMCKPKDPSCSTCPMSDFCFALNNNQIEKLPVKIKAAKKKVRHFNYLMICSGDNRFLQQRTQKDIWQNLYQFPLLETKEIAHQVFVKDNFKAKFKLNFDFDINLIYSTNSILSHQKIIAKIWATSISKKKFKGNGHGIWVSKSDVNKYAFPKMFDLFFKHIC